MSDQYHEAIDDVFRREWGRIVATIIRSTGDWDLAEECAAEAFARAAQRWPHDGTPENPAAWLTTTARNRATDQLRRQANERSKLTQRMTLESGNESSDASGTELAPNEPIPANGISDDRLRLIFTCCHPALTIEARVALTLRTLAGLSTAEIARAFLIPEATMAKRLVRAKAKIRNAGIPYRVPPGHALPARLHSVLGVVYVLFNEGYTATSGDDVVRRELCNEGLRLAQLLVDLMPDEPEAIGLLALITLHNARVFGRVDEAGRLVALEDQDRSRWDGAAIENGTQLLDRALRRGEPGPYQIQAAIAACHASARTAADTDWVQIGLLYRELYRFVPTPVVALNRAVAVAMADGPTAGLDCIDRAGLNESLTTYYLLHATRADLFRRLGQSEQAIEAYQQALALTHNEPEQTYLRNRIVEVSAIDGPIR